MNISNNNKDKDYNASLYVYIRIDNEQNKFDSFKNNIIIQLKSILEKDIIITDFSNIYELIIENWSETIPIGGILELFVKIKVYALCSKTMLSLVNFKIIDIAPNIVGSIIKIDYGASSAMGGSNISDIERDFLVNKRESLISQDVNELLLTFEKHFIAEKL